MSFRQSEQRLAQLTRWRPAGQAETHAPCCCNANIITSPLRFVRSSNGTSQQQHQKLFPGLELNDASYFAAMTFAAAKAMRMSENQEDCECLAQRDRLLQLSILNEEFLAANADHQSALITSLPFARTARRTHRLNGPVEPRDCGEFSPLGVCCENLSKPYNLEEGEAATRFP
jgi:hypothetical protein